MHLFRSGRPSLLALSMTLTCTSMHGVAGGLEVDSQNGSTQTPEFVSPFGGKCYPRVDEKGVVAAAQQELVREAKNVDKIIALGRAQGDVWRFHDAIQTYTDGIAIAPDNAMLYRHRGHRHISLRQFDNAVEDLEKAAKLDEKSFDIWYHLGLAHYLRADFSQAVRAYESCLKVVEDQMRSDKSKTDDSLVAISDWLYMTYRRARREVDAAKVIERITPEMNVKENTAYYNRLLMYKGLKKDSDLLNMAKADDLQVATLGYGVGNWHLYNGRREKAREIFQKIVSGKHWPAFGFIAAEAELVRDKR